MLIPVSARNPPGLWERLAFPRGPQGAPPQLGTSVSVVSEASDPAFPSQMGFKCAPPTLGRC